MIAFRKLRGKFARRNSGRKIDYVGVYVYRRARYGTEFALSGDMDETISFEFNYSEASGLRAVDSMRVITRNKRMTARQSKHIYHPADRNL